MRERKEKILRLFSNMTLPIPIPPLSPPITLSTTACFRTLRVLEYVTIIIKIKKGLENGEKKDEMK